MGGYTQDELTRLICYCKISDDLDKVYNHIVEYKQEDINVFNTLSILYYSKLKRLKKCKQ